MTSTDRRLLPALAGSLLLHALPFASDLDKHQEVPERQILTARLQLPPPAGEAPPLQLPEPPAKPPQAKPPQAKPPAPKPQKPTPASTPSTRNWVQEVGRQFKNLDERGRFYPAEAIARGLEGEVLVFFILDESGSVAAARVEESSGHRLLDEAALRAVKSLRSLPAAAPREALLPVRFRLR